MNYFDQFVNRLIKETPDNIRVNGNYISYDDIFVSNANTGLLLDDDPTKFIVSKSDLELSKNFDAAPGHNKFIRELNRRFVEMKDYIATNIDKSLEKSISDGLSRETLNSAHRIRVFQTKPFKYISSWGDVDEKKFIGMKNVCNALKYDLKSIRWDVNLTMEDDPNNSDDYDFLDDDYKNALREVNALKPKKKGYDDVDMTDQPYYNTVQLEEFFHNVTTKVPQIMKKLEEIQKSKKEEQERLEREIRLRAAGFGGKKKNYWEQ